MDNTNELTLYYFITNFNTLYKRCRTIHHLLHNNHLFTLMSPEQSSLTRLCISSAIYCASARKNDYHGKVLGKS